MPLQSPLPLPALIADVGGTNLRFALVTEESDDPRLLMKVPTDNFADMTEAMRSVLEQYPSAAPRSAVFAIAAPVSGKRITLTNASFTIDLPHIVEAFDLDGAMFLNDFEALAMALPALRDEDLDILHPGKPVQDAARVVLGPGTGLGAAIAVRGGDGYVPVSGEAGHITFGAETEEDLRIWPHITRRDNCISPEVVLSGAGLLNLYEAIAATDGEDAGLLTPTAVSDAARDGDPLARKAVLTFLRLLGRSAGDLALVPWAAGGIYLAGGVIDVLASFIPDSDLVAAVRRKSPHQEGMAHFPIYRIIRPMPALFGMAVFFKQLAPISVPLDHRIHLKE